MADDTCSIRNCVNRTRARGLCRGHLERLYRHGDPLGGDWDQEPAVRFWAKFHRAPDGCWLWTATIDGTNGYARFAPHGRMIGAHRWSYETFVGAIPDGLVIDHLCRVRHCVNPLHLEAVTNAENIRRGSGFCGVLGKRNGEMARP
jgi:hypothetical protein